MLPVPFWMPEEVPIITSTSNPGRLRLLWRGRYRLGYSLRRRSLRDIAVGLYAIVPRSRLSAFILVSHLVIPFQGFFGGGETDLLSLVGFGE
jgi:hypothetical protein